MLINPNSHTHSHTQIHTHTHTHTYTNRYPKVSSGSLINDTLLGRGRNAEGGREGWYFRHMCVSALKLLWWKGECVCGGGVVMVFCAFRCWVKAVFITLRAFCVFFFFKGALHLYNYYLPSVAYVDIYRKVIQWLYVCLLYYFRLTLWGFVTPEDWLFDNTSHIDQAPFDWTLLFWMSLLCRFLIEFHMFSKWNN